MKDFRVQELSLLLSSFIMKILVTGFELADTAITKLQGEASFLNTSTNIVTELYTFQLFFGTDLSTYSIEEIKNASISKVLAYAAVQGYSVTVNDFVWLGQVTVDPALQIRTFTNNPSRTIQTVAASANGFQLSTTKDAAVNYSTTIVTAATLLNGAVGSVVLEVASTNSSSAGSWQEIGRITNGQVFSLAVAIGCTQTISGSVSGIVPAGYYARLRSINTTGTPTYTYNSGQEVLLPTI